MKTLGILSTVLGLVLIFGIIVIAFFAKLEWQRDVGNYWDLSVKASTITQKKEYLDKYVLAIEDERLEGSYDAWFFETPNNSFDENLKAIKSLQTRLTAIQGMDENSFEYQTAIQQITAQEQDEAGEMLGVIRGVWLKENYPVLYFFDAFILLGGVLLVGVGLFIAVVVD